jgi:preprotein translocase subunit SecD
MKIKKNILWRASLIALTFVLSVVFLLPNTSLFEKMPSWWQNNMPSKGMVMGLDLQGGAHLVFEVERDKALEIVTERIVLSLNSLFENKNINASAKRDGLFVIVTPVTGDVRRAVEGAYRELSLIESEDKLVYTISAREAEKIKDSAAEQVLEVIRGRIDQLGVAEPAIYREEEDKIVVQLPGERDPRRAVEIIGKTAMLEFKLVDDESPIAAELPAFILPEEREKFFKEFGDKIPGNTEILFQRVEDRGIVTLRPFLLKKEALLTGDLLTDARVSIDDRLMEPFVSITFDGVGARIFEDITAKNIQKRLAIILDDSVYSAPVIRERIAGGSAQITGNFTMDEASDLAIVLRAGSLPAPVEMIHNVTVGPSLGKDSIEAGKMATLIATLLVTVFMALYYRLSGVIANFALVLNILLLLGVMASLNATLTLPGIAGLILAIGMAVDSNVLMFERIREELRTGKTPKAAIESGYKKAFWTIFDSNITVLIACVALFYFGTGPIKGFALTLGIGNVINLFTAVVGTKTVFDIIYSRKDVKRVSI